MCSTGRPSQVKTVAAGVGNLAKGLDTTLTFVFATNVHAQCGTIVDQGINESLHMLRAASQETYVISIDKVCEPQVSDLHASSRSRPRSADGDVNRQ